MSFLGSVRLSRPLLLDRYIVREMLAPSGIGLLVFTFVLLIDQIPRLLAVLVARSADLGTILRAVSASYAGDGIATAAGHVAAVDDRGARVL